MVLLFSRESRAGLVAVLQQVPVRPSPVVRVWQVKGMTVVTRRQRITLLVAVARGLLVAMPACEVLVAMEGMVFSLLSPEPRFIMRAVAEVVAGPHLGPAV